MSLTLLRVGNRRRVDASTRRAASSFNCRACNGERDALEIEWGQLKLEQSAWATHGRVEQTARVGLRMVIPRPDEVRIVKPVAAVDP